jgi:hypothetical protein
MQLTINISNEQLFDKVLWLLNSFKGDGLEIVSHSQKNTESSPHTPNDTLDFSSFKVDSFKDIDGLTYQKQIRDEW